MKNNIIILKRQTGGRARKYNSYSRDETTNNWQQ